MLNPFDHTFFRFLFGFILMLTLSFAVFFFIGRDPIDGSSASAKVEKAK